MRESVLSLCEKKFIQNSIAGGYRLDGRIFDEARKSQVRFGSEWGSCHVSLGKTMILAQVSCEITQPKQTRPNEGILFINVELGPMAGPSFEVSRQSESLVYLNRLLEKCFKDSRCVDLESLCIVVEEKVWSLRVDLRVMNHDGNLIECASIAALASLMHFKRPDVTRIDNNIIVHTLWEKDPIPTVLYHNPVCLTYAIFGKGTIVADPSFIEETVCMSSTDEGMKTGGGLLVVGMNQHEQLTLLDLSGAAISSTDIVHAATTKAIQRTKSLLEQIKLELMTDEAARLKREHINFSKIIPDTLLTLDEDNLYIKLKQFQMDRDHEDSNQRAEPMDEDKDENEAKVVLLKKDTAAIIHDTKNKKSTWIDVSSESDDET